MTVAYFVVLEDPDPGFSTYVGGSALAKAASNIDRIARQLGVKTMKQFVCADLAEYFDNDEDDFHGTVADAHEVWFEASEGLDWATRVAAHVESNPDDVHDAEAVLSDLIEYQQLFKNAADAGISWHLEVDI